MRLQARALMGAVAEWLLRRAPASTPEVSLAGLERDLVGPLLCADWVVGHGLLLGVRPQAQLGFRKATPTLGGYAWPAPAGAHKRALRAQAELQLKQSETQRR